MTRLSLQIIRSEALRSAHFKRLQAENILPALLYDCEPSLENWLNATSPKRAWFGAVLVDKQIAALFWITDFKAKTAFIHFACYSGFSKHIQSMGKIVCKWALSSPYLSCLLGLTPKTYRHVFGFMKNIGFEITAIIPDACHLQAKARYVDGVFSILTKDKVENYEKV